MKNIYYDYQTNNKTFLDMYSHLKKLGITNNNFFLIILNKDLVGVDPFNENLSTSQKIEIIEECRLNYWYFLREVIRFNYSSSIDIKPYILNSANLAFNFCVDMNMNIFYESPSVETGKTTSVIARLLWEYMFALNSKCTMSNSTFNNVKLSLEYIKKYKSMLPIYIRDSDNIDIATSRFVINKLNANCIKVIPVASSETSASNLGRGVFGRVFLDEFAFTPFNKLLYKAMCPYIAEFRLRDTNNRHNYTPSGIIIATMPADIADDTALFAYQLEQEAVKFDESWYDISYENLQQLIEKNTLEISFVLIRFNYKDLGLDKEWFESRCKDFNNDYKSIQRETLLNWDNCN